MTKAIRKLTLILKLTILHLTIGHFTVVYVAAKPLI